MADLGLRFQGRSPPLSPFLLLSLYLFACLLLYSTTPATLFPTQRSISTPNSAMNPLHYHNSQHQSPANLQKIPLHPFHTQPFTFLQRKSDSFLGSYTLTISTPNRKNLTQSSTRRPLCGFRERTYAGLPVVSVIMKINTLLKQIKNFQASCIPSIFSGKDVVVAAETGSGKTHGYLVPLIDKMCNSSERSLGADDSRDRACSHPFSLVLCPNVMLCEQVARMANCIYGDSGEPLLQVSAVCGKQGWPVSQPDILVSTPAALLNYLYALDPERRRRSDFLCGVKHVVFDEADMLLCGSFQNQVIRLINLFRFEEKQLSRMKNTAVVGSMQSNSPPLEDLEGAYGDELQPEFISDEYENVVGGVELDSAGNQVEPKKQDWKRFREIYDRSKQYIFVAATLPLNGKRTAGGVLKRMFPDANWVNGNYLHCHNPRLEQRWIEVTIDTQVDVLIDAVEKGIGLKESNPEIGICRTLVFANTVDAVEAVAKILRNVSIGCSCYHRDSSLEERSQNLIDFRERGGILVCTDAAARGLDIPNVQHVIQAEFAPSAVEFLHRVGRTARAGQSGLVTSLYQKSNRDLVAAVRQAGNLGQPVEKAFSRKRGFRNKIKKRGSKMVNDATNVEDGVQALAH